MAKLKVTTGHWVDVRRPLKDGTYPIKIRVTHNRRHYFFESGHSVAVEFDREGKRKSGEYEKLCTGKRLSEKQSTVYRDLSEQVAAASEVANTLDVFTWELFKKEYFKDTAADPGNLLFVMEQYQKDLLEEGRVGSANTYHDTAQSLIKYLQHRKFKDPFTLPYELCTPAFLTGFQKWMTTPRKEGKKEIKAKTLTSVGIHARNIRRIWNLGIEKYGIDRELYPFGNDRYRIPTSQGNKRALSEYDLGRLYQYEPTAEEKKYYDFWMLSFLLAGANMKDLLQLKYKNIVIESTAEGQRFSMVKYVRAKTMRTRKDGAEIKIPLQGESQRQVERIIKKYWAGPGGANEDYLFNTLNKRMTPERETAVIKQFTQMVNKTLGRIANKLELPHKPTSYFARHTWATLMLRHGRSADFIRPLLGHSTVTTTENYLSGFPDSEVASAMDSIIPKAKQNAN